MSEKQNKLDEVYMRMAEQWSTMSHAKRRKVGALIVKNGSIISDGFNGTPSGFPNECEDYEKISVEGYPTITRTITKEIVLHAEANAITKIAKSNNSSEGATLYVTLSPCLECAKLIIQSGIARIVFRDEYRILEGLRLLNDAQIEIKQVK